MDECNLQELQGEKTLFSLHIGGNIEQNVNKLICATEHLTI